MARADWSRALAFLALAACLAGCQENGADDEAAWNEPAVTLVPPLPEHGVPTIKTDPSIGLSYGPHFNPGSFRAELNGKAVTADFTPEPGTQEQVSLPMRPGWNVLEVQAQTTQAAALGGALLPERHVLGFHFEPIEVGIKVESRVQELTPPQATTPTARNPNPGR